MPIRKKFGTNAVKQIWAITYFTSVKLQQLVFSADSLSSSYIISGIKKARINLNLAFFIDLYYNYLLINFLFD